MGCIFCSPSCEKCFSLFHPTVLKGVRARAWVLFSGKKRRKRDIWEVRAMQKCAKLVDSHKSCKMTLYFQKSASLKPRTSAAKFHRRIGVRGGGILNENVRGHLLCACLGMDKIMDMLEQRLNAENKPKAPAFGAA